MLLFAAEPNSICGDSEHLCLIQVAKAAPRNREQWAQWSHIWPITWRQPDAALQPAPDTLSPEEAAAMCVHMRAALDLAAAAAGPGHTATVRERHAADCGSGRPVHLTACRAEQASSSSRGGRAHAPSTCTSCVHNAALIVDPATGQVIARGLDGTRGRNRHPLRHAVMAAVDAAAKRDVALWPEQSGAQAAAQHAALAEGACSGAAGLGEGARPPDRKRQRLEREGTEVAGGAAGAAAAAGIGTPANSWDWPGAGGHSAVPASAGASSGAVACTASSPEAAGKEPPLQKSYLCTGFDCYVVHEPCVMCAMALVHARLRRVIYALPDCKSGALGGALRLHAQRSLNHHYHAYHCGGCP